QNQVHDFNPGIAPSGLFWTVRIPDDALRIHGKTARLKLVNTPVIDSHVFGGPDEIPSTVSIDMTWTARRERLRLRPESDDPTAPNNFWGDFRLATASGS